MSGPLCTLTLTSSSFGVFPHPSAFLKERDREEEEEEGRERVGQSEEGEEESGGREKRQVTSSSCAIFQLVSNPQPSHLLHTVSVWQLTPLCESVTISPSISFRSLQPTLRCCSSFSFSLLFYIHFCPFTLLSPSLSVLLLPLS